MRMTRREFIGASALGTASILSACGAANENAENAAQESNKNVEEANVSDFSLTLDSAAWQYNADDDVYYQINIPYCETPADESYENLAIFVPGAYFEGTDNGDGTFTCTTTDAQVGSYTAATAPIVVPVNTPGYSAMAPLSEYSSLAAYTSAGIVYVHAGCRGRDAGAPAGVCDLKAAVRFIRHVADKIAGDTDRIITFGMSGGGAQSALMGATGDSELYAPYLDAIGAAGESDAIFASMDWCPITGLDVADEAYEWMMGTTRSGLSEEEQAISDGLATAFATYVNESNIVDENGVTLTLEESAEGIYQAGSYYERVRAAIEESLNNFLADTTFPYDASTSSRGGMGGPGGGGGMRHGKPGDGEFKGEKPEDMGGQDGQMPEGEMGEGGFAGPDGEGTGEKTFEEMDNITRNETSGGVSISGTYETVADYIQALNADKEWVAYDETTNTATITSVADFCAALKQASKSLGAFDQLDRGQGENTLFGESGNASHFDQKLGEILEEVGSDYAADYSSDLERIDSMGTDMQTRVNMYTPLFYLLPAAEGFGQSEPAKHWRIRTGINQSDTSLTTELNLMLALKNDARVESVDFATVWGQGHVEAERTGDSETNFIEWVCSLA